jgi:glycosyltransferase involved in cell wall biosynthesis
MILHTVVISYQRLDLTQQAVASYLDTVTVPFCLTVVDNGSSEDVTDWILENAHNFRYILLGKNKYPGYACNRGWERAADNVTVLHRADNDWRFLPGWCEEVQRCLEANPRLGQLGLRTGEQELHNGHNVGGNCVIRRELYDQGLRYDERPWPKIRDSVGAGYTEDSLLSPQVTKNGWEWGRVEQPCIETLADENPADNYYWRSWEDRGTLEQAKKAYGL